MDKSTLRTIMKNQRNAMTAREVSCKSSQIYNNLLTIDKFCAGRTLLSYISVHNEADTTQIISYYKSCGKSVTAPKVNGQAMDFYYYSSDSELISGGFGIPEPATDNVYVPDLEHIAEDVIIIPGLAFDIYGGRTGYGGGYYDRYLAGYNGLVKIAICYDFQIVDEVETDRFDIKPDYIVTDKRVIKVIS